MLLSHPQRDLRLIVLQTLRWSSDPLSFVFLLFIYFLSLLEASCLITDAIAPIISEALAVILIILITTSIAIILLPLIISSSLIPPISFSVPIISSFPFSSSLHHPISVSNYSPLMAFLIFFSPYSQLALLLDVTLTQLSLLSQPAKPLNYTSKGSFSQMAGCPYH